MKHVAVRTPFYAPIRNVISRIIHRRKFMFCEIDCVSGRIPHLIKQKLLKYYKNKYELNVFVETGTYCGDMIEAMKNNFNKIYSIELSPHLYKNAKKRFNKYKHIEIIQGDSAIELIKILKLVNEPALFWLDGHYSGGVTARGDKDTPIIEELSCILKAKKFNHVIVIDDARCFGNDLGYPSVKQLEYFVDNESANMKLSVCDDCIIIEPNNVDKLCIS